jgi:hypothetical protein
MDRTRTAEENASIVTFVQKLDASDLNQFYLKSGALRHILRTTCSDHARGGVCHAFISRRRSLSLTARFTQNP